jgi:hypothetical protein
VIARAVRTFTDLRGLTGLALRRSLLMPLPWTEAVGQRAGGVRSGREPFEHGREVHRWRPRAGVSDAAVGDGLGAGGPPGLAGAASTVSAARRPGPADGDGDEEVAVELALERFVTRPQGSRAWLREGRRALDAERERQARPIPARADGSAERPASGLCSGCSRPATPALLASDEGRGGVPPDAAGLSVNADGAASPPSSCPSGPPASTVPPSPSSHHQPRRTPAA